MSAINWERARRIFGFPSAPKQVWQQQFDGFDEALVRLASSHWRAVDFGDLWYYHHDLAYVELQPDLFAYVFPMCLMDWHDSLLRNKPCSHGDSEFHYGVQRGEIFERMMSPVQRTQTFEFFRDSFLDRLDRERGFVYDGMNTPAYGWMGRFNSLGLVVPHIDMFWEPWWSLETPGRAVAALQYCSGLMYFADENPLFDMWTPDCGGGEPCLWCDDSHIHEAGWLPENVEFVRRHLTVAFVLGKVKDAATVLQAQPERKVAQRVLCDLPSHVDHVAARVAELPDILSSADKPFEWSV